MSSDPNTPTTLAAPSLDCASSLCLHVQGFTPDRCTAYCETDRDCLPDTIDQCPVAYEGAPVVSVGPFACRKVCVCVDRVPASACP